MLSVSGLSVRYGAHRALEDAAIRVDAGEVVVILGANGAGKSSLLKAIAGTSEGHTQGTVKLEDHILSGMPAEEIVTRGVAFVPEGRGIFGDLSVGENLLLGAHSKNARVHQDRNLARVYELFPKLKERDRQIARTMSGGEQQMVAIGRAMMADPKILMLDEPSLGLSPLLCKELFQNLSHIRDTGIGVLMVEQNAKQSLAISDRAYLLENGTITGENSAAAMMDDPAVQAAYLGGAHGAKKPRVSHIAVTDDNNGSAVGLAKPDAEDGRTYLQPSVANQASQASGALANVDISAIVSRASNQAAGNVVRPSRSSIPTHIIEPEKSSGDRQTNGRGSPPSARTDDDDIQNLLTQFETAAFNARQPASSKQSDGRGGPMHNTSDLEDQENLPKIPVYRKSKVEVYRRTPAGDLTKVEEV